MEQSGLARVAPDACISFSRLTAYRELLDSVESHGYRLVRERGRVLEPTEVALHWFEHVYLGALETFDCEGLEPQATKGDLFLCVQERRRQLQLERSNATIADAAREVLAADQERSRPRLRRLLSRWREVESDRIRRWFSLSGCLRAERARSPSQAAPAVQAPSG